MNGHTIGSIARRAGVGVETIRFYERRGLIARPPRPAAGGYRQYPDEAVARVRFIRQAQALGFSLAEIDELLGLRAADSDCAEARAAAKLDEVERKMAGLSRIRAALRDLVAACPGEGALDGCAILSALDAEAAP